MEKNINEIKGIEIDKKCNYILLENIGKGGSSKVCKALCKNTNK